MVDFCKKNEKNMLERLRNRRLNHGNSFHPGYLRESLESP